MAKRKRKGSNLSRRRFLQGVGGATLALPFLNIFGRGTARAGGAGVQPPDNFIVVVHRQGMVMDQWYPRAGFTLPRMLAPLDPVKQKVCVVSGVSNLANEHCIVDNGHSGPMLSTLTSQINSQPDLALGASIDQVLAQRIGGGTPFRSLDLAAGKMGGNDRNEVTNMLYSGPNEPVTSLADPADVFNRLFGAGGEDSRAKNLRVIDAVKDNFDSFRTRLGREDRDTLDAHAQKIVDLENRYRLGPQDCGSPGQTLPPDYDFAVDDNVTAPAQIELLALALACGQTRVGSLMFNNAHDPQFPWLSVNGGPVVDPGFTGWHDMVHLGREPVQEGLLTGYEWYSQEVARLLMTLDAYPAANGETLLDRTMVLWISDYGEGLGHFARHLPVVLAGNLGGAPLGRYINGGESFWDTGAFNLNQLYVSILNAFGFDDTQFGYYNGWETGPLPGLV